MRRYRKASGQPAMRPRRRFSLAQAQNGGVAMGMMAFSGGRGRMSLVQRAQAGIAASRPQLTQGQAQRAGVTMGMMAASGKRGEASGCNERFGFRNTCGCS